MGSKDLESDNLHKNTVEIEPEKVINLNNSWILEKRPRIYIEDIGESLYSMPSCSSESDMSYISSSELRILEDSLELSFENNNISKTPVNTLELSFNDTSAVK